MHARLRPLGWRVLTARLDIRDTIAYPTRALPPAGRQRRHARRITPIVHALAVHRREDDLVIGRLTIERDARGLAALRVEPESFASSPLASEAIDAIAGLLPSRRRHIEIGAALRPRAHFAPTGDVIARAREALGIDADYGARRHLPEIHEPRRLRLYGPDYGGRPLWLLPEVVLATRAMLHAAAAEGIVLQLVSGFRSVGYQVGLIRRKLARGQSLEQALSVLAAPGHSEHHSGRAIDITTPGCPPADTSFENTHAFAWLNRHAGAHGFRLSYPKDNPHGIMYEPWHWYFVS